MFDPKDLLSVTGFLAPFKLACNKNRIHKAAVMWVLPHYVIETFANALNSCTCATNKPSLIVSSVRNVDNQFSKFL